LYDAHKEWLKNPKVAPLIQQLQMEPHAYQRYTWKNDELHYKGCIYLNKDSTFKSMMLFELHASTTTSHSRFHKTYGRIKHSFLWEGMKKIHTFVAECDLFPTTQGINSETSK
jgi:hypothetical protein